MSKYDQYVCFAVCHCDAQTAIEKIKTAVNDAIEAGWTEVYILPDEDMITVRGVRPPDQEAIKAAKEKRRKQYERLKKEFDGEASDRVGKEKHTAM